MTNDELWAEYARLSQLSRFMAATHRAWAIDDALMYIIDHIEAGTGAACTLQHIENRVGNAKAKFRKRLMLGAKYLRPADTPPPSEDRIEIEQRLERCSAKERFVLVASGLGFGAAEIAGVAGAPIGSVKTWVFRARAKFNSDRPKAA